jgi:transcriptional antiterminator NusG
MTAVSDLDQEFAADDFEAEAAAVLSAAEEIAETAAADVVTTAALDVEIDAELIVDAAVVEIEAEMAADVAVEIAAEIEEEEDEDPIAAFKEQMRISPGDWYVIHSYAGYENKVKGNLESRVVSLNVEDYIFQVEVPMEEVTEIKGGVRKLVRRNKFPGYVLVRMELTDESWGVVRHTPGVTGFVGHGHQPAPLTLDEVVAIPAVDLVALLVATQHVGVWAAPEAFDVDQHVTFGGTATLGQAVGQIHEHRRRPRQGRVFPRIAGHVAVRPAVEVVGARPGGGFSRTWHS